MTFLLKTLIQWRKFIIASALLAALVMAGISLVLPMWYTASTSMFPPETGGGMGLYSDLLQGMQIPLLSPGGMGAQPETIYIDILKSRSIGLRLIEEFDFQNLYQTGTMAETLRELHSRASFQLMVNGMIVINFEDRDPERAAAVANRFAELLDEFNKNSKITRASKTREFIEKQLEVRSEFLEDAEEALRDFQEQNQTIEINEQVKSALEIVSSLTGEAIALEVEMEILGQYASKSSDEFINKKSRYDEISSQLRKFKQESARDEDDMIRSFFPTFDRVPQVTLDYLRLLRQVKIEETVYELLIKEYEKSKIEETRDTPTVQILDRANVPELRSRPKRKFLVIVGGLAGLGWSALLSVLVTLWRKEDKQRDTFKEVFGPVMDDLAKVFRRKK
jgi:tyrosine-protein kinase Etk/Wzc